MEGTNVLVLNQNYEPLNVCHVRRALVLVLRGKAEVVEAANRAFHTTTREVVLPSVIRLIHMVRRPRPRIRLTRKEVFARDGWLCVYCGKPARELTLDHVLPRHRGGAHTWENLVTACKPCNHRKAGFTPQEAHMTMMLTPSRPRVSVYYPFFQYLGSRENWRKFVPGYDAIGVAAS